MLFRMKLRVAAALTAAVVAAPAAATPPVLNETAYWRIRYQMGCLRLSAKALKAEGEALLKKRDLQKLEKQTKILLARKGFDWSRKDWRDVACVFWGGGQGGQFAPEAAALRRDTVVPADWTAPGFDDQSWMTRNFISIPSQSLRPFYMVDFSFQHIHSVYLRGYFDVPEPAEAGDLVLQLTYRGGARVLVNGQEVARGHLPAGKLPPEMTGQDYPKEAYLTEDGKDFIGDHLLVNKSAYPAAELKRVAALRDRVIGPVTLPARALRKGRNVLAIEIRGSAHHPIILPGAGDIEKKGTERWFRNWHRNARNLPTWEHAKLVKLDLRSSKGTVPSALSRPERPRVWVEDMHRRLYSADFQPRGMPMGTIRIVGARNGSFSAQLAVATGDRPLRGLRATAGALRRDGSAAAIPVSAVEVSYLAAHRHDMNVLSMLGGGKGRGSNVIHAQVHWTRRNYGLHGVDPKTIRFFDRLSPAPPDEVKPASIQPIWVRLQIPDETPPGLYKGALAVAAEGMRTVSVPMEVEVIDWRIPDPLDFQTHVQSEQSPYGVARHYKVKLWSDEHFKLMESSFRQLARLGNDYVFIPVIHNTEFGNHRDSPIKWIRRTGGTLAFDYTILDRYLDLAVKYLGKPRVICFVIMMMGGESTPPTEVAIRDEATGAERIVGVGPKDAGRDALWGAFAKSLCAHMKQRGLGQCMYWGYKWDIADDRNLMQFMANAAPGVHWASGGHNANLDKYFRAVSRVYGTDVTGRSKLGWKNPFESYTVKYGLALDQTLTGEHLSDEQKSETRQFMNLLMPRCLGSVITVDGSCPPFPYRVLADRALHAGFGGIARMGADYFGRAWFSGCRNTDYLGVGRQCTMTLWPGEQGAESGARNEAMLEGIQEAEARIYLEQAIDRGALGKERAVQIRDMLNEHMAAAVYLPVAGVSVDLSDYACGWQDRSRRLYETAAAVARRLPLDLDRLEVQTSVPELGRTIVPMRVRNWTSRPRAWKASADRPWIVLARTKGRTSGQQELGVVVDGTALQSPATVTGTLTVTDSESKATCPVKITARVTSGFELVTARTVCNATVGQSDRVEMTLVNRTAAAQDWRMSASAGWVKFQPPAGKLPPGATAFVKAILRPPDRDSATRELALELSAAGGRIERTVKVKVFVIPKHRPRAKPPGEVIFLDALPAGVFKRHRSSGLAWWLHGLARPCLKAPAGAKKWKMAIGGEVYEHGMVVVPRHETVYNLTGSGFNAFSAHVGTAAGSEKSPHLPKHSVNFEIHVDGKVRAQSGMVRPGDRPRLLVVDKLAGAKEIRLVTRLDTLGDCLFNKHGHGMLVCIWGDPAFHK